MCETYEKLNKGWKNTCKIVLGDEIGELKGYEKWLSEYINKPRVEKSNISNKDIYLNENAYCKNAKYMAFDEINYKKKFEPLNINEIKDIDFIVQAVKERIYYTGNVVLGNSQNIEKSASVIDCFNIYNSNSVSDSKYIAFGDTVRKCQYIFGAAPDAESSYSIRCVDGLQRNRGFESYIAYWSDDCYYSSHITGCSNVIFCFGATGKRNAIGNLELPKQKYQAIKTRLLEQIRSELKQNKRIFSIFDLIENAQQFDIELDTKIETEQFDKEPIEKAFTQTCKVVLKKPLTEIDSYKHFLNKHVRPVYTLKSSLSGQQVLAPEIFYRVRNINPKLCNRTVTEDEILAIGRTQIKPEDAENVTLNLEKLSQTLRNIAFYTPKISAGNNKNLKRTTLVLNAMDCYEGSAYMHCKRCAYDFWPRESEYIFGSNTTWTSSFCINSYYSKKLTRCMEVDSCESCSDLYYSHNCENVHDSMFCFNSKNIRNAIGNVALTTPDYMRIKKMIVQQLADELETKKDLKWDIYNVGC